MSCLDEETIAAFAETRLPPDGIAALEAHVGECAACRALVSLALAATPDTAAAAAGDVARAPRPPHRPPAPGLDPATLAPGTAIGRYTMLGLVGRGGMGEVYAAYDPELDRRVAVKVLNSNTAARDGRSGSRLLREAKAIAKLHHPNVVVVHDAGSFADRVFIAMEYVDGRTLAAWLGEQPQTQARIIEVFSAAGRGLQAAHAAGLVHRDFKPQNVMVTNDGNVRVMDFGLARAIGAVDAIDAGDPKARDRPQDHLKARLDPALTKTGELLGTPLYMAPEQFAAERTDARTDQFSFCVALYEALHGAHPFGGGNLYQLAAAVVEGRVLPPPAKSAVAPWLRRILLRGLSPRPDDRYPSMAELLAALGRDPAKRRRRVAALVAGVLVVVGIATGSHRLATKRASCDGGASRAATAWTPERRGALERAFLATGNRRAAQALAGTSALLDAYAARWSGVFKESCEATHLRGEQSAEVLDLRMSCLDERLASVRALVDTLASADTAIVDKAVSAAAALPTLDRCNDVIALRAIVKPPDDQATRRKVGELRERLAAVNVLSLAGRCEQAMRIGRPIKEAATQIGYLPLQAETSYALGLRFDACGDTKDALADLEDAVMSGEASRYDEIAIEAAAHLANARANRTHDVRAARVWLRLAEAILARFPGHPRLEARVVTSRAIVLLGEGRLEDALYQAQRGLAMQEVLLGPGSIDVAMSANNLAVVLHELGRDQEAEAHIRRVREITLRTFGDDTGQLAVVSMNEAEILTGLGRFEEAHRALERAFAILRQQEDSGFLVGYGLLDQGKLELAEGRPRAAVVTLERSLALIEGQDPRYAAEALFALARALVGASPDGRARAAGLARKAVVTLGKEPSGGRLAGDIQRWLHANQGPPGQQLK